MFWPFSGECIFITFGCFGHFRAAAFLLFWAVFCHVRVAAILFSSAVFATFGWLQFYYFRLFWPFPGGCIFMIFGCFGHFRAAAFLIFSAVLAIFGRLHLYYFRPFWPFSGGSIYFILNRSGKSRCTTTINRMYGDHCTTTMPKDMQSTDWVVREHARTHGVPDCKKQHHQQPRLPLRVLRLQGKKDGENAGKCCAHRALNCAHWAGGKAVMVAEVEKGHNQHEHRNSPRVLRSIYAHTDSVL